MKRPLRVLFFSYPASFQNIGGGEILLLKLKEYLEKSGVEVTLFDMWRHRIEDFDVLHVFGSVKDCLGLMEVAESRGVIVAITPLIWSSWKRAIFTYGSLRERLELLVRHAAKVALPGFPSKRRRMMMISDIVFPNSQMDLDLFGRLFAIPKNKMRIVYNGVDARFRNADAAQFRERYGNDPFALSVGRIEPRKNQLNLIRAFKKTGLGKLVLIGNTVSGFEDYRRACETDGRGFAEFIPGLAHEDSMLSSAYAASKVYVLPGWFETPGLVALEAALAGSSLAVTGDGSTREYFGESAAYFNPADPDSIGRAIREAAAKKDMGLLKDRIMKYFTWDAVARSTIDVYREALSQNARGKDK